jgi:hypothetical protein
MIRGGELDGPAVAESEVEATLRHRMGLHPDRRDAGTRLRFGDCDRIGHE